MQTTPIRVPGRASSMHPIAIGGQWAKRAQRRAFTRCAARGLGMLYGISLLSSTALAATGNVDVYGVFYIGQLNAYETTLHESGIGAAYAGLAAPNLALNGAHHRTLLGLKGANESGGGCAWGTVDFAQARDAHTHLAEIGACKDIGAARLGIGIGRTKSAVDRSLGGKSSSTGDYLIAEWATPMGHNLEASATGLYGDFETDHRRNYSNGLLVDTSLGRTDARSTAIRLRLDWRDAAMIGNQTISPYVAYSWSETKQDAYTETGGSQPESFADQHWRVRDLRMGAASRLALSAETELHLAATAIHVFGEDSIEISGSGFTLGGKQDASNRVGFTLDFDHRLVPRTVWSAGMGATSSLDSGSAWVWSITTGIRGVF